MAPLPPASNIRAFVHWYQSTVYAGEEIECIITFKNVASTPGGTARNGESLNTSAAANGAVNSKRASYVPSAPHSRRSSVAQTKPPPLSRANSVASTRGVPPGRGHRPALSLSVVSAASRGRGLHSAPIPQNGTPNSAVRPSKGHGRSLSIISLGSEPAGERTPTASQSAGVRPIRSHARSTSLQQPPRLVAPPPAGLSMPPPRQPSPLYEADTPQALPGGQQIPMRPARRRPGTVSADHTPQLGRQASFSKRLGHHSRNGSLNNFKFPATQAGNSSHLAHPEQPSKLARSPSTMHSGQKRPLSPRLTDGWNGMTGSLNPVTRVMSETSAEGTPRSSSELYSTSNHSDETLTSEVPSQQPFGRLLPKGLHSRRPSRSPQSRPAEAETLMMAYAQTLGHFTLDGSLVNTAPFEEVKRKAVQGGGGVVGVERSRRSSGLFGALSWGNIGESLGGLLGGDEMSSMAQMKATVGSKTIPLLSTPQSLLFVDLRLGPGESQSYNYRFSLPRGLPPSHRGRAIKVTYNLLLGVQRPEGQAVKRIEIPFRVLGSYDNRGDTLGHDLMSPYVLLQDSARTAAVAQNPTSTSGFPSFAARARPKKRKTPKQGLEDFLRYTERLMESPKDANGVLLSPTSPTSPAGLNNTSSQSRQASFADPHPANVKEAIDFAILRSNLVNQSGERSEAQSVNRFNIARSGQPVAVLAFLRPAYRLGEAVIGIVDFTAPASASSAPIYSVLIELESAEQIDPSLALRSSHSINRVTRKVHASTRENSLFARQISFNLAVPANAAPTFETTGVSLTWRLRVEFTTQRQVTGLGIDSSNAGDELLEELASDERGTTFIAKERLPADTFEIAVPLKVFGAVGIDPTSAQGQPLFV
ncbi:hypothetical protein DOTSEDRAFT_67597 [Dothistroma septosporum NZE10]|uniref:Rgp1-domain-containing protein n=1 Tax=Dothistroma septosporum (strain NZE10 / CBS 128990) TaxID=675120 RepID=N1PYP2_DOTSN|nr:hypothetical protein DOTSEDRAFT_67597 [Dothistroma septosporum NZE10]